MSTSSRTTVFGAETFYARPVFRSAFFLVDTFLLLLITGMHVFVLFRYWPALTFPSIGRLFGILLGIWLVWWKAYTSHQRLNSLYSPPMISKSHEDRLQAELLRVAATMTHNAMFFLYLLVALLLMNYDYVLNHHR